MAGQNDEVRLSEPRRRGRLHLFLLLRGVLLAMLALPSCGDSAGDQAGGAAPVEIPAPASGAPAASPRAAQPIETGAPAELLPPTMLLTMLRDSSTSDSQALRAGDEYEPLLPKSRVTSAGGFATFSPVFTAGESSIGQAAFVIYSFDALDYDRDPSVRLNWDTPPVGGNAYLVLANFTSDRWDTFALDGKRLTLGSFAAYTAADGTLLAAVLLTGTDAAVLGSVRLGSVPPVPMLDTSVAIGPAPLSVEFDAAASLDPDGEVGDITDITGFEWDLDGDGTYELDTLLVPTAERLYDVPGSYQPSVRITDMDGVTATASTSITVKAPPMAVIAADPAEGYNPQLVQFDAAASTDPDGTVANFEWDIDGDSTFELDTDLVATTQTTYVFGSYTPAVRVTDDEGYTSTASIAVTVNESWMTPPDAQLTYTQDSGRAPSTVSFDASASTDDVSIAKYEWDWTTDGTYDFDSATDSAVQYTYMTPGDFGATVRVTDNLGATATATVQLTVGNENRPPYARLAANPTEGYAPLTVTFDASTSTDPDGDVLSYSWDLDDDGIFEAETGTSPTLVHEFIGGGYSVVRVRASDGYGGTSARGARIGVLTPGWAFEAVAEGQDSLLLDSGTALSGSFPNYKAVPAFAWHNVGEQQDTLRYSSQSAGGNWLGPYTITSVGGTGLDGWGTHSLDSVSGRPAASYSNYSSDEFGWYGDVYYIRAANGSGSSWGTPVHLYAGIEEVCLGTTLGVVGGKPAVAFLMTGGLWFAAATDAAGTAFSPAVKVTSSFFDNYLGPQCIVSAAGWPALCYIDAEKLYYVRALNATGSAWGAPVQISAPALGMPAMISVGGYPAIAWKDDSPAIRYVAASNFSGSQWGTPQELVGPANGLRFSLLVADGKPALSYTFSNQTPGGLLFIRAADAKGDMPWLTQELLHTGSAGFSAGVAVGGEIFVGYVGAGIQVARY